MTNATQGSSIDDEVGNLEKALCDIVGIPIDTDITAALFTVVAGGLQSITLGDAAADPTTVGVLQRSGSKLLWHNGERAVELQPAGEFKWFGGTTAPAGWLLLDGAAVSRTTYARLFAVFGTQFGVGDGSTTFNLPNVKGRTLVGQDPTDPDWQVMGQWNGAKTQAVPSHAHDMQNHTHVQQGTFTSTNADALTGLVAGGGLPAAVNHTHNVTLSGQTQAPSPSLTGASGSGSVNVIQPSFVARLYVST